jgi:plasmid stabilization system protein ParE
MDRTDDEKDTITLPPEQMELVRQAMESFDRGVGYSAEEVLVVRPKGIGEASKSEPKRVFFSPEATRDLERNYHFTQHKWGTHLAERYTVFLTDAAAEIATQPLKGKKLADYGGIFVSLVRWKNPRYDQNIVNRETENGIYVLRILDIAMDAPLHGTE